DSADGYPGIAGFGAVTAVRLLNRYGIIEAFPPEVLGSSRDRALLFKNLATLRTDARLFDDVDELRWRGPTPAFPAVVERLGDGRLLERCLRAKSPSAGGAPTARAAPARYDRRSALAPNARRHM